MSLILIFTPDEQVGQLFRLELCDTDQDVQIVSHAPPDMRCERSFIDADAFPNAVLHDGDVAFSRNPQNNNEDSRLTLPFPLGSVRARLREQLSSAHTLQMTEHGVKFRGTTIQLTETEHALLSSLIQAGGTTVTRRALMDCMRGGTEGAVNVYMHYLRKKLEHGERILLATRGGGYRIDPRFLS